MAPKTSGMEGRPKIGWYWWKGKFCEEKDFYVGVELDGSEVGLNSAARSVLADIFFNLLIVGLVPIDIFFGAGEKEPSNGNL